MTGQFSDGMRRASIGPFSLIDQQSILSAGAKQVGSGSRSISLPDLRRKPSCLILLLVVIGAENDDGQHRQGDDQQQQHECTTVSAEMSECQQYWYSHSIIISSNRNSLLHRGLIRHITRRTPRVQDRPGPGRWRPVPSTSPRQVSVPWLSKPSPPASHCAGLSVPCLQSRKLPAICRKVGPAVLRHP